MTFRVGQKVVCVDDGVASLFLGMQLKHPWNRKPPLKMGEIYTIRAFENRNDELGIYLVEVSSNLPPFSDGGERSFLPSRFRPIVERKTDISVFTAMLTEEKIGASA